MQPPVKGSSVMFGSPCSALVAGAPEGTPPADASALERSAAARAATAGDALGVDLADVCAPAADRGADCGAGGPAQRVQVFLGERVGAPAGVDAGLEQDLVGEQVPHP